MYKSETYNPWRISKPIVAVPKQPKRYFRLVAPPPNVTGELHIGHILNLVLQRIISIEWEQTSASGYVQRVIGLDHAGLAVKRVLELKRANVSASLFWCWKRRIGKRVLFEIRRTLAPCALGKIRFTLDRPFSVAVAYAFVKLYKAGMVKAKLRLLCWDGVLNAFVSKLETSQSLEWHRTLMWRFAFEDGESLTWTCCQRVWVKANYVLGTRILPPERARWLIVSLDNLSLLKLGSANVIDAATGKKLRLVANVGAFDVSKCVCDKSCIVGYMPVALISKSSAFVSMLIATNTLTNTSLLICVNVRYSLRTGARVHTKLTKQWFVDMCALLKQCDIKNMRIKPARWRRALTAWVDNIGLWCVSRTMSWGHNLPIWWYADNFTVCDTKSKALYYLIRFVGAPLGLNSCGTFAMLVGSEGLVFDTWFSSALWWLSCLGWPNKTRQLKLASVGVNVVLTGFDIIFFWVIKMALMSGFLTRGKLPVIGAIIHPIVYDSLGQKMSKTKHNVISPKVLFNSFGLESVRAYFSSVNLNAQQFKMCLNTLLACRNASTKLWNIQRASCNPRAGYVCTLYICKWANASVFIRAKRIALMLRCFATSEYLNELLNTIRFDLSNYANLNFARCSCVQRLCNFVCWRYRAVLARACYDSNLDTYSVGAQTLVLLVAHLVALTSKAIVVCTNCIRLFCQAKFRNCMCQLSRVDTVYFKKLRLTTHWHVGLWCGSLFAWC
ncbi:MAG: class I tRNA ligase family protein [Candidatus Hodgkinia cicadicola]